MPTFPTLSEDQDSSLFDVTRENPAVGDELEGGYVATRPRHTRTPRKTWTTGFTRINEADRVILDAFWDEVRGGSVIFNWTDPVTLAVFQVRFKEKLNYKYVGVGGVHKWNVRFVLEQA